mgnify:CR=1 FL=1
MILLTGAAGFIGFHTAQALLARGEQVIGVDNINDYYDPVLKHGRLKQLDGRNGFTFYKADIADEKAMNDIMERHGDIDLVIHLAAQAGVRYSIENPQAYTCSNLDGQMVMLEIARKLQEAGKLKHFVYASSSSVYGANTKLPFSTEDPVEQPVSLYAATKRAGELLTQSYAHLYGIPATGLRFFTVYGPWGRPDMAYFSFTRNILEGTPIRIFNQGDMRRDFTWIDDIVAGILAVMNAVPQEGDAYTIGGAPHRLFNLGNNRSEKLLDFIDVIEQSVGKKAVRELCEMAQGDVKETYADIDPAREVLGYDPKTPISEGIPKFVEWYQDWKR